MFVRKQKLHRTSALFGSKIQKRQMFDKFTVRIRKKIPSPRFFCRVFEKSTPHIAMPMVSVDREKCSLEHGPSDIIHNFVKKENLLKLIFWRRYTTKLVRPFTITMVTWLPCVKLCVLLLLSCVLYYRVHHHFKNGICDWTRLRYWSVSDDDISV